MKPVNQTTKEPESRGFYSKKKKGWNYQYRQVFYNGHETWKQPGARKHGLLNRCSCPYFLFK